MTNGNERVERKTEFMNKAVDHTILLNGGTASAFVTIVAANWSVQHLFNILLLAASIFLAWNAFKAADTYFKRFDLNDALYKAEESKGSDSQAKQALSSFRWIITIIATIAILIQIFLLFDNQITELLKTALCTAKS